MADPPCHYCDRPAEAECPTCGRLYCLAHGEDVCLRCLAPDSVLPSAAVYRGSVLALIVATVIALYLLARPPAAPAESDVARPIPTNTPAITATATPTPPAPAGAVATPSPMATPTAVQPTPTATPAVRTYTVQPGDTLSDVAARFGTTVEAILALNPGVRPETLQPGTELRLPPAP